MYIKSNILLKTYSDVYRNDTTWFPPIASYYNQDICLCNKYCHHYVMKTKELDKQDIFAVCKITSKNGKGN